MPDEYPTCVNCGGRIQKINFALGPEWRHWPTPHGNYRTNELYRHCQSAALVATPKSADPSFCPPLAPGQEHDRRLRWQASHEPVRGASDESRIG